MRRYRNYPRNLDPRWLKLRFGAYCAANCQSYLPKGVRALYWPAQRIADAKVYCESCGDQRWREFLSGCADERGQAFGA